MFELKNAALLINSTDGGINTKEAFVCSNSLDFISEAPYSTTIISGFFYGYVALMRYHRNSDA